MAKLASTRTIIIIVLAVLALRSLNVRSIEQASDIGDVAGIVGSLLLPTIFALAMLGLMFWPRSHVERVEPGEANSAHAEPVMMDETFVVTTFECRYCKTVQKVHVADRTGGAQVGDQLIRCIKCGKDFAVTAMDKIIGGPFAT
jgi:hypothetical protein